MHRNHPSQSLSLDAYASLNRARAYIDRWYNQPLSLEEISSKASFSRYHFIRLFRRAYHRTPHQYLTQKRIEKAKELLRSSGLSVTDICFAVGFQSLGSFSMLFQKHVGLSPARYRASLSSHKRNVQNYVPSCFLIMLGIDPN